MASLIQWWTPRPLSRSPCCEQASLPARPGPHQGCSPRRCIFLEPTPPPQSTLQAWEAPLHQPPRCHLPGPGGGLPPSCPRTCRSQPSRGPARRQRVSPEWSPHPPASPGGHRREGAGALPRVTGLHLPEWGCGPSRRPPVLGRRTPGQSSGRPGRGQGRRHPESRSRHGLAVPPATGRPGPVGTLAPRPR